MNDRQIAKLHKRIATEIDAIEAVQAELSISELTLYEKFRPADMLTMITDLQRQTGSSEADAAVLVQVHWRNVLNKRLAVHQDRLGSLLGRLERNGTPYVTPALEKGFAESFEIELAEVEQTISEGERLLDMRRETGDNGEIDLDMATNITATLKAAHSRRQTLLRRLGRYDVQKYVLPAKA